MSEDCHEVDGKEIMVGARRMPGIQGLGYILGRVSSDQNNRASSLTAGSIECPDGARDSNVPQHPAQALAAQHITYVKTAINISPDCY
jgi:hypothetical protein